MKAKSYRSFSPETIQRKLDWMLTSSAAGMTFLKTESEKSVFAANCLYGDSDRIFGSSAVRLRERNGEPLIEIAMLMDTLTSIRPEVQITARHIETQRGHRNVYEVTDLDTILTLAALALHAKKNGHNAGHTSKVVESLYGLSQGILPDIDTENARDLSLACNFNTHAEHHLGNIKLAGRDFNLIAAADDCVKHNGHRMTYNGVQEELPYHPGGKGLALQDERELVAKIQDRTYNGEWVVPPMSVLYRIMNTPNIGIKQNRNGHAFDIPEYGSCTVGPRQRKDLPDLYLKTSGNNEINRANGSLAYRLCRFECC